MTETYLELSYRQTLPGLNALSLYLPLQIACTFFLLWFIINMLFILSVNGKTITRCQVILTQLIRRCWSLYSTAPIWSLLLLLHHSTMAALTISRVMKVNVRSLCCTLSGILSYNILLSGFLECLLLFFTLRFGSHFSD